MFNLYIFCLITLVISYPQGVNLIAFLDSLNDQTSKAKGGGVMC